MRVAVIGAGIVGPSSAHLPHAEGIVDAAVVDAACGRPRSTRIARRALPRSSAVEPWNPPRMPCCPIRHLVREDAAVPLHARTLPSLLGWRLRFPPGSVRRAACRWRSDRRGRAGARRRTGSAALAAAVGRCLPDRPAEGYSLTIPLEGDVAAPGLPVNGRQSHVALAPPGSGGTPGLRVAGTAGFCGDALRIASGCAAHLAGLARCIYPELLRGTAARRRRWPPTERRHAARRPLAGHRTRTLRRDGRPGQLSPAGSSRAPQGAAGSRRRSLPTCPLRALTARRARSRRT